MGMETELETILTDDGENWTVRTDNLTASGRTMDELDNDLKRVLNESGQFDKGSSVKVFMRYDFSNLPTWFRQYQYHYFNRSVTIDL